MSCLVASCFCYRPGSIQTATQERFIRRFEKSFRFLMQSFPTRESLELSMSAGHYQSQGQSHSQNKNLEHNNKDDENSSSSSSHRRSNLSGRISGHLSSALSSGAASLRRGLSSGGNSPGPGAVASPLSPSSSQHHSTNMTTINEHTNTSLYLKSLKQSVTDQFYLLSPVDQASGLFQHVHKLVYFTSLTITALCKDHVQLAHLGITGLNKLVPRENTSYKFTSNLSKHNMNILMNAPSYMVATNSMSQGLEETILTDIKLELNVNKWTRFMSVADMVSIALNLGKESVRRLTKVTSTVAEEGKSPNPSNCPSRAPSGTFASPRVVSGKTASGPSVTAGASANADAGAGEAGLPANTSSRPVVRANSMFRNNSFKETSDADYNKSRRVSANIMAQLLIDWLETRQNCVFDVSFTAQLLALWTKHYPRFGGKLAEVAKKSLRVQRARILVVL